MPAPCAAFDYHAIIVKSEFVAEHFRVTDDGEPFPERFPI
jgi:hypothetical protein